MWNFRADFSPGRNDGFSNEWWKFPLKKTGNVIPMPVPSSFNDITTDFKLREYVGWVWYDREVYASSDWRNKRVVLRIDSAHYFTQVWLNGVEVMSHVGGHLPFEAKVNDALKFGQINLLTVAVNNTLSPLTLPPGTVHYANDPKSYPPGYFTMTGQFDFFNYAGIHRSVRLYTTPTVYVDDITIITKNASRSQVAQSDRLVNSITISNPTLWRPYSEDLKNPGYQYTLKVELRNSMNGEIDVYRQKFGIRTIRWTDTQLLINDKPFYCHGVAKHEDSDIRGKGLDYPLIARDFNMLNWLGANCFRTSHYPYAEEIMDQADAQGVVVFDESPGVGISKTNMGPENLKHHLDVMKELVRRDKNRPSVIIWSVANEPQSNYDEARDYFKSVIDFTRKLDPTRPISFADAQNYDTCKAAQFVDIIFVNRYYSWYSDMGHTEVVAYQLPENLNGWHNKFKKPVIITEYGADTISGLHTEPANPFSEEYQAKMLESYHKVFDDLKKKFLVGEMVWNFADFMTDYAVNRVNGNKKGLLTRQRQPKAAAHRIRERYWRIINANNSTLFRYDSQARRRSFIKL
ncbi:DgyrCDS9382 [Dimorphilus gyrociliatus]|uniref:Beta-glucuronidase n=1 Tax=Dimorphilus gyrociliatus TaxID=2664684 RepID=A0A7I8VWU6_9ANNE|nr:DgyrCDS9382 [Dimorphilus gyrociliatus]